MNRIVETRYGNLIYPDKDMYVGKSIEKYGEYSYFETEFLKSLINAGDVVIDVGANIGALTVPLAQKIGPSGYMLAFEPQQFIYYILCGNIALNNLANTHVFQRLVAETDGEIRTIPVLDFDKEGNFGALTAQETAETVLACPVSTVSIDALQLTFAKLIKVDVEGAEVEVLRGAKKTIERSGSYLYVECLDIKQAKTLLDFLDEINYSFKFHQPPLFNPDNFFGNQVDVLGENIPSVDGKTPCVVSGNFFCYPEKEDWSKLNNDPFFFDDLEHTLLGQSATQIRHCVSE